LRRHPQAHRRLLSRLNDEETGIQL
jgi:hypothetical protein